MCDGVYEVAGVGSYSGREEVSDCEMVDEVRLELGIWRRGRYIVGVLKTDSSLRA